MKPETLKALQESIAHHERVLANRHCEKLGVSSCALCQRFYLNLEGDQENCQLNGELCPVRERTGEQYCNGSPYYAIGDVLDLDSIQRSSAITNEEFAAYEAKEIEFLRSLLPPATESKAND